MFPSDSVAMSVLLLLGSGLSESHSDFGLDKKIGQGMQDGSLPNMLVWVAVKQGHKYRLYLSRHELGARGFYLSFPVSMCVPYCQLVEHFRLSYL